MILSDLRRLFEEFLLSCFDLMVAGFAASRDLLRWSVFAVRWCRRYLLSHPWGFATLIYLIALLTLVL